MPKLRKTAVVTDLDNTLFDWVDLWVRCFGAMFDKIVELSGIPAEELKAEIRRVHRKHGTSEYSFLIEELPSLKRKFGRKADLTKILSPAIQVYREERRRWLSLYPTVAETLLKIKGSGAKIIGYTESMAFYSNYRVRRLGLDGVIDVIFSPEDHRTPKGLNVDQLRKYPAAHYKLKYSKQLHTPKGSKKPDHKVLDSIIRQMKIPKSECVYIGDSLFKDVAMAQDCDVDDAWAQYGVGHMRPEYKLLQEVTHWTDKDVEKEQEIKQRQVQPKFVLKSSYSELLQLFEFGDAHA